MIPHRLVLCAAALALAAAPAWGNATITILNTDGPGEGFNDATPAAPVGGNLGTTIGQQRLIAFQYAADLWAAALDSNVAIVIESQFNPLFCDDVSAVAGGAGATSIFSDFGSVPPFPGAQFPVVWYHSALADKRAGAELSPGDPDLFAQFNSNLGSPGCFTGLFFYYGLDNNHGTNIDLVATLLHEFGHGLGFSQFANVLTGVELGGQTDVYARNLLDQPTGLHWDVMNDTQRQESAIHTRKLSWDGPNVTAAVPGVLDAGTPFLRVNSPASIDGDYTIGEALFGPPLSTSAVTGPLVQALDASNASGTLTTDACTALTNGAAVSGKLAFVDRGTCAFTVKVKNCQNAGAIGVVVANNVIGAPPPGMAGTDATITIPSLMIAVPDAVPIRGALGAGVNASLLVDASVYRGADTSNRMLVFTPIPATTGSSVSHWDQFAAPDQLMEPVLSGTLTHQVDGVDLTLAQMRDIGWFPDADVDGLANATDTDDDNDGVLDGADCAPLSAGAFAVPALVTNMRFGPGKTLLTWNSAAPSAGTGTVHHVVRGTLNQFPVGGGAAETCLGTVASASITDTTPPGSGRQGFWYLVRGSNVCGDGSYGSATNGTPRLVTVCP